MVAEIRRRWNQGDKNGLEQNRHGSHENPGIFPAHGSEHDHQQKQVQVQRRTPHQPVNVGVVGRLAHKILDRSLQPWDFRFRRNAEGVRIDPIFGVGGVADLTVGIPNDPHQGPVAAVIKSQKPGRIFNQVQRFFRKALHVTGLIAQAVIEHGSKNRTLPVVGKGVNRLKNGIRLRSGVGAGRDGIKRCGCFHQIAGFLHPGQLVHGTGNSDNTAP